jgi:hypothetical protein
MPRTRPPWYAIHLTPSGAVERIAQWGPRGGSPRPHPDLPAVIRTNDGDGHHEAWRYTGRREDAIAVLAPFVRRAAEHVVFARGDSLEAERAPPDFWIMDEAAGHFLPNLAAYPDAVSY